MIVKCERCEKETECQFYGSPSDVEEGKAQNGEWICEPCVPLRTRELDEAIAEMKSILGDWGDA